MAIEELLIQMSYFAIFFIMISNGIIGFPSSQILYIISGYFISKGDLHFGLALLAGTVGNVIGNQILYEISRKKGMKYISRIQVIPLKEIKKVQAAFKRKGLWFLFFGKLVNPIKIVIPIPAGISKMNRGIFLSIITITSAIWASIFLGLGIIFGKSINLASIYAPIFLVFSVIILYVIYRYMNSKIILEDIEKEKD